MVRRMCGAETGVLANNDPVVVRIVDRALAVQGWSHQARKRMIAALRDGRGVERLSTVLKGVNKNPSLDEHVDK